MPRVRLCVTYLVVVVEEGLRRDEVGWWGMLWNPRATVALNTNSKYFNADSSKVLQEIPYNFRSCNMAILQLTGLNGSVTPLPSIAKTKRASDSGSDNMCQALLEHPPDHLRASSPDRNSNTTASSFLPPLCSSPISKCALHAFPATLAKSSPPSRRARPVLARRNLVLHCKPSRLRTLRCHRRRPR